MSIWVGDVDAVYKRCLDEGATSHSATDMEWHVLNALPIPTPRLRITSPLARQVSTRAGVLACFASFAAGRLRSVI